jgi:hypothetical protein
MNFKCVGLLFVLATFSTVSQATATVYNVNIVSGSQSAIGTVTTDSVIGDVQKSDITAWNIQITNSFGTSTLGLDPTSRVGVFGGLTATSSGLFFDFSSGGVFIFQTGLDGPYLCVGGLNAGCGSLSSIAIGTIDNAQRHRTFIPESSVFQFAIAAPVPELSTWAMMILGFAGLGFMTYRRRKAAAVPPDPNTDSRYKDRVLTSLEIPFVGGF